MNKEAKLEIISRKINLMEMEIDLFKLSIELFKVDMEEPKKKRKRITKNYE